jgi:uncharacterized protein RhaS with RHS repeats
MYTRRQYSPQLGRWLSRDPIEEKGGIPLYVFVSNNGVSEIDPLGLTFSVINDGRIPSGGIARGGGECEYKNFTFKLVEDSSRSCKCRYKLDILDINADFRYTWDSDSTKAHELQHCSHCEAIAYGGTVSQVKAVKKYFRTKESAIKYAARYVDAAWRYNWGAYKLYSTWTVDGVVVWALNVVAGTEGIMDSAKQEIDELDAMETCE